MLIRYKTLRLLSNYTNDVFNHHNLVLIGGRCGRNLSVTNVLHDDIDKNLLEQIKKRRKSEEEMPCGPEMEQFHSQPKYEHPIKRTNRILKNDMKTLREKLRKFVGMPENLPDAPDPVFPTYTDVLVVGGGVIGSSIAYWLKQRAPDAFHLTVVEKDSTYSEASTTLSVGGLRQQFSLPESIQMSMFGAHFLRNIKEHLSVKGHPPPDAQFQPYGYLFLANEKGAETLKQNSELQQKLGAKNVLLTPTKLKDRFPWLNTDGIELGCLGLENEGWFDPWSLLNGFKQKAINLGAEYVQAELVGFDFKQQGDMKMEGTADRYEHPRTAIIKMPSGEIKTIKFAFCVIAAGANSGIVAKMAKIGLEGGLRSIALPIERRKRFVYCFHCENGPGLNTPLTIDPTGTYFRREGLGGNFIGGCSPKPDEEPSTENLDVDYDFFDNHVWPTLARRVPQFENIKLKSAWAGYYEYNTLDANGVVGPHPAYHNLYIASGFSGHGIQHAPAIGRAVMEMIIDGEFKTIDLSRLGFDRHCLNEPLREKNIW